MPSEPMSSPQAMTPRESDRRLATALESLANPVRLTILRALREPRVLKEIRVASDREGETGLSDGPISRQSVKEHLERLLKIDAIEAREAERSYGPTMEYVLNHQTLFTLAEEFRGLARLRPEEPPESETLVQEEPGGAYSVEGPCLVTVKGLEEGKVFPLDPEEGRTRWTIGRRRGLEVTLDFDPFVSSENTEIRYDDGTYVVRDLPRSRNGTRLNFVPLPDGGAQEIGHGDLVGVGRSILSFQA